MLTFDTSAATLEGANIRFNRAGTHQLISRQISVEQQVESQKRHNFTYRQNNKK